MGTSPTFGTNKSLVICRERPLNLEKRSIGSGSDGKLKGNSNRRNQKALKKKQTNYEKEGRRGLKRNRDFGGKNLAKIRMIGENI